MEDKRKGLGTGPQERESAEDEWSEREDSKVDKDKGKNHTTVTKRGYFKETNSEE